MGRSGLLDGLRRVPIRIFLLNGESRLGRGGGHRCVGDRGGRMILFEWLLLLHLCGVRQGMLGGKEGGAYSFRCSFVRGERIFRVHERIVFRTSLLLYSIGMNRQSIS